MQERLESGKKKKNATSPSRFFGRGRASRKRRRGAQAKTNLEASLGSVTHTQLLVAHTETVFHLLLCNVLYAGDIFSQQLLRYRAVTKTAVVWFIRAFYLPTVEAEGHSVLECLN